MFDVVDGLVEESGDDCRAQGGLRGLPQQQPPGDDQGARPVAGGADRRR
ncbi:hypothetical protein [Streptomyces sp. NEAU-S77]